MKVLFIREVPILKRFWSISEVEFTRSLNKLGVSTTLIGMGNEEENREDFIHLIEPPLNKASLFQLKIILLLPFYVFKNKFDVIITDTNSVLSVLLLFPFKLFKKIRFFLDIRTIPVEDPKSRFSKMFSFACKFAEKYFDGILFITKGTQEFIESNYNIQFQNNVLIRPSGIDTELFSNAKTGNLSTEFMEKIKDKFTLFYHGSISPTRGIHLVLDAINKLKNEIPNLLFISISDYNEFVRNFCKEKKLDLEKNLLLLDTIPNSEIPKYVKIANICLVPLPRIIWWEVSSPLKLLEYLSMEKTIILSDIRAHVEIVPRDSDYVVYFNPDIANDLSQKIIEVYKNFEGLNRKVSMGRKLVQENFTWDKQAKDLVDFVNRIA